MFYINNRVYNNTRQNKITKYLYYRLLCIYLLKIQVNIYVCCFIM